MATNIVKSLIAMCDEAGIVVPTNIRADQKLIADLIREALTKLDPNVTAVALPVPAAEDIATAVTVDNSLVATFATAKWLGGLLCSIELTLGTDTGTVDTSKGYTYDLTELPLAAGTNTVAFRYVPPAAATGLGASDAATFTVAAATVSYALTGCETSDADGVRKAGTAISGTLTLLEDFDTMPSSITVESGETALVETTDYTYDALTGAYSVLAASVVGAITITAVATGGDTET